MLVCCSRSGWTVLSALLLFTAPFLATVVRADETVFDFDVPGPDQIGDYVPGSGAGLNGGVGELLVEADWFDAEWGYALPVTVDNLSMGTLSEWTLAIDVDGTTAGGAAVLAHADAGGADLRLVQLGSPQTVSLQSLGTWSATLGRGRLWWQEGSLPAGVSQYKLFFGNPTALSSDDPAGVFSYTNAYAVSGSGTPS